MMEAANLAVRFILELLALFSIGYWGFHTGKQRVAKIGLGIGAPLLLAIVWATLGSPGAPVTLSPLFHLLLELVVFGVPALALIAVGKQRFAFIYGLAVVINRILMFIWQQ